MSTIADSLAIVANAIPHLIGLCVLFGVPIAYIRYIWVEGGKPTITDDDAVEWWSKDNFDPRYGHKRSLEDIARERERKEKALALR